MTREEAKSCISTIEMLQRLAYNIHGVMDVIDADNCKKIIKALEQKPSGDLISRQAVQDYIAKYLSQYLYDDVREAVEVIDEYIGELPPINPQEPSVEILKTEESNDNGTKYLNINVSDDEVKRNPDIVRLCSDVGVLEYVKPRTGHWIKSNIPNEKYVCSECGGGCWYYDYQADVVKSRFCPNCGAKMVEPQERSDKE